MKAQCKYPGCIILVLVCLSSCSKFPGSMKNQLPGNGDNNPPIQGQDCSFIHKVLDPAPPGGLDCCTDICLLGDFNKDGYAEIVLGAEKAGSEEGLVLYTFPAYAPRVIGRGQFTTDGDVADMDGDEDLDFVISDYGKGIYWYENPYPQSEAEWTAHFIGMGYGHDVVAGDMDNDGDPDVVICDKKKLILFRNDLNDTWNNQVLLQRSGEGTVLADMDGDSDLDIAYGAGWLENQLTEAKWNWHLIDEDYTEITRLAVKDMNNDNRPDLLLCPSETKGSIIWLEAPLDRFAEWTIHLVDDSVEGVHSLLLHDLNDDGELDIIAAEMHTSPNKQVMVYFRNGPDSWKKIVLSNNGAHNMRAGDLDGDGDADIVGKNYSGRGRVLEAWFNTGKDTRNWEYMAIDQNRDKSQMGKMGLVFQDLNDDRYIDIVAGSFTYINPGITDTGWRKEILPGAKDGDLDVFFAPDVDGDADPDLVGFKKDKAVWLERVNGLWNSLEVASVPDYRTQGYLAAELYPGEGLKLLFTRGKGLYALSLPSASPEKGGWALETISTHTEEEGFAIGDVNGDSKPDIVTSDASGHNLIWLSNPGKSGQQWQSFIIGSSVEWMDRICLVDINGDGRQDVVCTEETQDWEYNANLYWFEAPAGDWQTNPWTSHIIVTLRSINSLDYGDVDGDGDIDLVLAEHTDQAGTYGAPNNLTLFLENRKNGGLWKIHVVERGPHSSHLGTRLVDVNNDGYPDLVSLAWQQYRFLHAWKNNTYRGVN